MWYVDEADEDGERRTRFPADFRGPICRTGGEVDGSGENTGGIDEGGSSTQMSRADGVQVLRNQFIFCPLMFTDCIRQSIDERPFGEGNKAWLDDNGYAAGKVVHEVLHYLGDPFRDTMFSIKGYPPEQLYHPYGAEIIAFLAKSPDSNLARKTTAGEADRPVDVMYLPEAHYIFCLMSYWFTMEWYTTYQSWRAAIGQAA